MDRSLALLVHRNLMDVSGRTAEASGGTVRAREGALLFASSSKMAFLNGVMRENASGDAAELLAGARTFFAERERDFVVYAWPGDPELEQAALSARMLVVLERYPEMVCRSQLEALPGDVRAVEDLDNAAAYWRICDEAYPSIGFPQGLFTQTFDPQELLGEHVWACIGYVDGRPAACASLWMAGGIGFVGWVAALPDARGRGLAAACTVRVTNRAFELGSELASLQASSMGEPIYRRLGYEELYAYRVYGSMPSPS